MKRVFLVAVAFLVVTTAAVQAQEPYRPVIVSVRPAVDFPPQPYLTPLFRLGGGVGLTGAYVVPFFMPLSVGVDLNYDLARMKADVGDPGSVSFLSAATCAELRFTLFRLVDLFAGGGAGYFFGFINDQPSSNGGDFVWFVRAGLGAHVTSTVVIDAQGAFRFYREAFNYWRFRVSLGATLRLGGEK